MSDASLPPEFERLMDTFGPEDLHPDLVPHVSERGTFMVLSHPLVLYVMYTPALNKIINRSYAVKKAAVEDAIKSETWNTYVFLHERPYRFDALQEVMNLAGWWDLYDEPELWKLIGSVWTDSENIWQQLEQWREIWQIDCSPSSRAHAMDEDEQATLAALPETFTVWRGATHKGVADGLSWTPDKAKAIWFARRYAHPVEHPSHLAEGTVSKSDVLACFSRENETVILPEFIRDIKVTRL
jgi:hypothetical protein